MKSYTDLEQSKKLAEILPLESADMCYILHASSDNPDWRFDNYIPPMVLGKTPINELTVKALPCWSLTALFVALPDGADIFKEQSDGTDGKYMCTVGYKNDILSTFSDNHVDACVAMIEKLHELKML